MKSNIYRLHKYKWTPLLRFGAGRTRDVSDGWHAFPDNAPLLRMMGGKYINPDNSEHYVVVHETTYTSYDAQVAGTELHIKYDPTKLTSLYYRYSNVSEILFDLNTALDLEVLSFREHMINFGNLNLNNLSKLRSFEISRGGSIDSVVFHSNAPLNYIYLDETTMPQSVIDYCVVHAYNSGITNGQLISPPPSCNVEMEAQALVDRGWVGFSVPVCSEPVDTTSPEFTSNGYNNGTYISDQGTTWVLAHWSVSDNVGITSQRIYYRAVGGTWSYVTENNLVKDEFGGYNYQLNGLTPGTTYELYVRAYDAAGNYTDSTVSNQRTTPTA